MQFLSLRFYRNLCALSKKHETLAAKTFPFIPLDKEKSVRYNMVSFG